jgi:hypothetical protein
MQIHDINLYLDQYDEKILIDSIDNLTPIKIIKTQKNLSNEFIQKYILESKKLSNNDDEDDITISILQMYQPNFFSKSNVSR